MPEEDDDVFDEAAFNEAAESRREDANTDEGFLGDCREDVPYGEVFYVMVDGQQYLTCTHTPPHMHAV